MSKYIPGNQKHLSLEDRKYIEQSLNHGSSFKDIARFLCKDPTTISKEVSTGILEIGKGTTAQEHSLEDMKKSPTVPLQKHSGLPGIFLLL